MKKIIIIIIGIWLSGFFVNGDLYASRLRTRTVRDNNRGNRGDILIHSGTFHCGSNVGHWTDIKTIPELKGDKGDKGDRGEQGLKGDKGDKGDRGEQGIDFDPAEVNRLDNKIDTEVIERTNTDNLIKNVNKRQDNKLVNHENKINNLDNRVNKLEETQYNIRSEIKFIRNKNLEVGVYGKYNINRSTISEVGLSITIGVGKSWTEKELEKTNLRLDSIERNLNIVPVIEKVVNQEGILQSIRITETGLEVNNKF